MFLQRNRTSNGVNDLVSFIESNLVQFEVGDTASDVRIATRGFRRQLFCSGIRPCASVTIRYVDSDGQVKNTRIWVKRTSAPEPHFQNMWTVYKHLQKTSSHGHMPVPFCIDDHSIYMSQACGTSLNVVTIYHLLHAPWPLPMFLVRTFMDVRS